MNKFERLILKDGIYYADMPKEELSATYLAIRTKEQRILSDEQVLQLPFIKGNSLHEKEWLLRAETQQRFLKYVIEKKPRVILEIGCGNGWFANSLAPFVDQVIAQDINLIELHQGRKVFKQDNLHFVYADDLAFWLPTLSVEMVVFNASFQYFKDVEKTIAMVKQALIPDGEIHILDTPIYRDELDVKKAQKRSNKYYEMMEEPQMAKKYFHHVASDFRQFKWLYTPKRIKIAKYLGFYNSPFPWLVCKA